MSKKSKPHLPGILKHNIPRLIEEIGRTYGKEGSKAAEELGKAVQSSIRQVESLKRRK